MKDKGMEKEKEGKDTNDKDVDKKPKVSKPRVKKTVYDPDNPVEGKVFKLYLCILI